MGETKGLQNLCTFGPEEEHFDFILELKLLSVN